MDKRIHLVLKYSEDMYKTKDVIALHNQIAFRKEAVWLGKPYHEMGSRALEQVNEQFAEGFMTLLYLIDKHRKKPIAHVARLFSASVRVPKEEELIPPFYREKKIRSRMKVWLKVGPFSGIYLEDHPDIEKANKFYEQAVAMADQSSEYFLLYEND